MQTIDLRGYGTCGEFHVKVRIHKTIRMIKRLKIFYDRFKRKRF